MVDPTSEVDQDQAVANGLSTSPLLLPITQDACGAFWVTLFSVFGATLFIPLFPIYTHNDVLFWIVPVWAVYVVEWIAPLLAIPIIVVHITVCFYIARFSFPYGEHKRSISLLSIFVLVSVICIFIAMTARFHDVGFVATFLVFSSVISSANLFASDANSVNQFRGFIYPRLSVRIARIMFWLSCSLSVIGLLKLIST